MSARALGAQGENIAWRHLEHRGAKLLARNYRRPCGEIDLIVRLDGRIVFVEVKARSGAAFGQPSAAVDARKQARVMRAAELYLKENRLIDARVRFDVVEVLDGEVRHIPGAFWRE